MGRGKITVLSIYILINHSLVWISEKLGCCNWPYLVSSSCPGLDGLYSCSLSSLNYLSNTVSKGWLVSFSRFQIDSCSSHHLFHDKSHQYSIKCAETKSNPITTWENTRMWHVGFIFHSTREWCWVHMLQKWENRPCC